MSGHDEQGGVWAVWRHDRRHRIRFPNRASAERWLVAREVELWDIVPIDDDTDHDTTHAR